MLLTHRMGGRRTAIVEEANRRHRELAHAIGVDLRTLREDAGVTLSAAALAAGIDRSHLRRIERGERSGSLEALVTISTALGARLSVKPFPDTGPRIRDRHQVAMLEALLALLHPRWRRLLEVAVHRPARGYIDAVLTDPDARLAVAAEVQSDLRRFDQQLRWAADKAQSLPSAPSWSFIAPPDLREPVVSHLLVLRSTAATRDLACRFPKVFEAAYPARPADVHRALTTDAPWPGSGILWARVEGGRATILPGPPRGVALGR
jgi:transcriptional regulator with XRE-family HTH domain